MRKFTKTVKIDFGTIDDKDAEQWAAYLGLQLDDIPDLDVEADVEFDASELTDSELEIEYQLRFRDDLDAISRTYRYLSEGDVDAAMELMAREFRLPDPLHEKKLAALIARGRTKEASHAEN